MSKSIYIVSNWCNNQFSCCISNILCLSNLRYKNWCSGCLTWNIFLDVNLHFRSLMYFTMKATLPEAQTFFVYGVFTCHGLGTERGMEPSSTAQGSEDKVLLARVKKCLQLLSSLLSISGHTQYPVLKCKEKSSFFSWEQRSCQS